VIHPGYSCIEVVETGARDMDPAFEVLTRSQLSENLVIWIWYWKSDIIGSKMCLKSQFSKLHSNSQEGYGRKLIVRSALRSKEQKSIAFPHHRKSYLILHRSLPDYGIWMASVHQDTTLLPIISNADMGSWELWFLLFWSGTELCPSYYRISPEAVSPWWTQE